MELKVVYAGAERVVTGLTEDTTCQDIIYALAHASGHLGRFVLIEQSAEAERSLAPSDRPFQLLQQRWAGQQNQVRFILKHLDSSDPLSPADSCFSTASSSNQTPVDDTEMLQGVTHRLTPTTDLLKRIRNRSTSQLENEQVSGNGGMTNGNQVVPDQNGLSRGQSLSASSIQQASTSSNYPTHNLPHHPPQQPNNVRPSWRPSADQSMDTTTTSNTVHYGGIVKHAQVNGLSVDNSRQRTNSTTNSVASSNHRSKPPPPSYDQVMQRRRQQQNHTPVGSISSVGSQQMPAPSTNLPSHLTNNMAHMNGHQKPTHNLPQPTQNLPAPNYNLPNGNHPYQWPANKDDLLKMIHLQELRLQEQRQRLRTLDEQHPSSETAQHRLLRQQIAQHQQHRTRLRREIEILTHRHQQQQQESHLNNNNNISPNQLQQQPQQQPPPQQHKDISALRAHLQSIDAQLNAKNEEVDKLTAAINEMQQRSKSNVNGIDSVGHESHIDGIDNNTANHNDNNNEPDAIDMEINRIENAIVQRREKLEQLMKAVANGSQPMQPQHSHTSSAEEETKRPGVWV